MVWCTWAWKSHQNTELSSKRTWISEWRSNKNPTKSSRIVGVICHAFLETVSLTKSEASFNFQGFPLLGEVILTPPAHWLGECLKKNDGSMTMIYYIWFTSKTSFKPVSLCSNPTVATTYAQDPLIEILPSQPSWLYTLCFSLVKHQHVHLTIAPRAFIFSI